MISDGLGKSASWPSVNGKEFYSHVVGISSYRK